MPRALSTKRIIRKALVEILESEAVKPYLKSIAGRWWLLPIGITTSVQLACNAER